MKCKITNKKIEPFMSFGKMPISNNFLKKEDFKKEYFFEMEVGFSETISLLQLINHPEPNQMFNNNYPFFTSSSQFMVKHFKQYADWIMQNFLKPNSRIIEIGSNDGTMLKNFVKSGYIVSGIEPSKNCADIANKNSIKTLNSFFSTNLLSQLESFLGNTDAIIAANCICHIPNLEEVFKTVEKLLSKNGVFIFEEPYLGSVFDKVSYDQIYDEHIYLFSVTSIMKIAKIYGFELIDVIEQATHGGSMRYVISRKNKIVSPNVKKYLEKEKLKGLDTLQGCLRFKSDCEKSKEKLVTFIRNIKSKNCNIAGYAATSKSTTVLNYCGIGTKELDCIYDTTKEKIGKYSPGKHIPIVSHEEFTKNYPDYAYLLAYNHKDEIYEKEKEFSLRGGKWFSHVEI